jgi:hypothetical protein
VRRRTRSALVVPAVAAAVLLGTAAAAWATVQVQWQFAPDASGTVVDDSGHGRALVVQGRWTTDVGLVGTAASFQPWAWGLGPTDAALDPGDDTFAVSIRFRAPTGTASPNRTDSPNLVQKGLAGSSGQWKLQLRQANGGQVQCRMKGTAGYRLLTSPVTNVVSDTAWHVASCLRTPTSVSLVVDGVTTSVAFRTGTIASTRPVTVANKATSSTSDQFVGLVDAVAVASGADALAESLQALD